MRRLVRHPRVGRWIVAVGTVFLRWIIRFLALSWRFEVRGGREHLDAILAESRPVVLCYWHNRLALAIPLLLRILRPGGLRIVLLASHSRDGDLITRIAKPWRFDTVRGSATRGGTKAVRALYKGMTRENLSPLMMPDGPQGPIYGFKVGVAILAQMAQAPILPMGFAAKSFVRIKSWDRLILPLPFSRIVMTVGEPQTIPRGLSPEALEEERSKLEDLLGRLTSDAEAALGVEDIARGESR